MGRKTAFPPDRGRVLVVTQDWFCAAGIAQAVRAVMPATEIATAHSIAAAKIMLHSLGADLVLADIVVGSDDIFELLPPPFARPPPRCFIITHGPPLGVVERLRRHGIAGVFDSAEEDPAAFNRALQQVAAGHSYYSPGLVKRIRDAGVLGRFNSAILTPTEQVVFAAIGDGSDDGEAAVRLGLKPSSIKSVRRQLHRKLGFRTSTDLVRFAVQYGVVQFTARGAVRVGFNELLASRRNPRRPVASGDEPTVAPFAEVLRVAV